MAEPRELAVRLHGRRVGTLSSDGGTVLFTFDHDYWVRPDRPTLSLWFEEDPGRRRWEGTGGNLPAFFANLEPEGALRRYLARALDLDEDPLALLEAVGGDLPGAVTLESRGSADPLATVALVGRTSEPAPAGKPAFSVAGVQLKLSMSRDHDDRLVLPAPSARGDVLVKVPPPGRFRGLSENEHATMTWARRAGFDVPQTSLVAPEDVDSELALGERALLVVERFDRLGDDAVHQEDFCQILGLQPELKEPLSSAFGRARRAIQDWRTEAISLNGVAAIASVKLGEAGVLEFLRRVTLALATGNADIHLKNWSVVYPDRKNPSWSPLYDQVSTIAWDLDEVVLPLFGARSFNRYDRPSLLRLAEECGITSQDAEAAIEATLRSLRGAWSSDLSYPEHHRAKLLAHWRKHKLLCEFGPLEG